jgi:hypothetical protein
MGFTQHKDYLQLRCAVPALRFVFTLVFGCARCVLRCSASGFCELGISWQSLENPHMKAALGMPKGLTGIYITKTEPMFEASRVLKAGDVLTSFNGEHCAEAHGVSKSRQPHVPGAGCCAIVLKV